MLAKIIDDKISIVNDLPINIILGDRFICNPTKQDFIDFGYQEMTEPEKEGFYCVLEVVDGELQFVEYEIEKEPELTDEEKAEIERQEVERQEQLRLQAIEQRTKAFYNQFFETSLGWIRRNPVMKNGSIDNFLNDSIPLLAMALQNNVEVNVLTYSLPDFTQEFTQEYIESLQELKPVTQAFIQECLQIKATDFGALE